MQRKSSTLIIFRSNLYILISIYFLPINIVYFITVNEKRERERDYEISLRTIELDNVSSRVVRRWQWRDIVMKNRRPVVDIDTSISFISSISQRRGLKKYKVSYVFGNVFPGKSTSGERFLLFVTHWKSERKRRDRWNFSFFIFFDSFAPRRSNFRPQRRKIG